MNSTLGRKQRIKNSDWLAAMQEIERSVTKEELDGLVEKTAQEIREKTAGKKAAFSWSGGKDSLVLERICQMAGISACVLVICNLEYKAFLQWVEDHKPQELAAHPQMLFPQDSSTAAKWFHIVQHRGQARYYKENGLDMILLGRRKADGNYVGKGSNIYTNSQGVTRYSPLADWSHEQILAFIHYYNVEMPPIYEWPNGYSCGTHPWAARQWTGTIENGWKEVYEIDKTIPVEAAELIQSARTFLETALEDNQ
jgi:3'-phosphoadenosine 5'-phosphosulfate sulfotransferase (PAPS reductase)/FAD synthetase